MGQKGRVKIRTRLNPSKPCFSFEFFPPKTPEGLRQLWATLEDLRDLEPGFVSVTYGAGGSSRDLTVDLVTHIKERTGIEAMAHLTCVGHSQAELEQVLEKLAHARIENILALRGDAPTGAGPFQAAQGGFAYASELVDLIRQKDMGFCVGAAAYPEGHLETLSREADLKHLKVKVDDRLRLRHHPALLRQRVLFRLRGAGAAHWHQRAHRAGHHADHQLRAGAALRAHVRRHRAHAPAAGAGEGEGRPRRGDAAGRGARDGAVLGAARAAACPAFTSTRSTAAPRRA